MEEQKTNTAEETASTKLLANKEYEYVINFRHRFLTYYALPLFVLFLTMAGLISYFVRVPEARAYPISLDVENETIHITFKENSETADGQSSLANQASLKAIIRYSANGKALTLEGTLDPNGVFRTNTKPTEWPTPGLDEEEPAELVVTTIGDRLFNKLVSEVIENMGIKKPALE